MWSQILDRMLRGLIRDGRLTITYPDGSARTYGGGVHPDIHLSMEDDGLPRRFVLSPELALGEGYMDGTIVVKNDDLEGLMELAIRNSAQRNPPPWRKAELMVRRARRRFAQYNPLHRARANVAHHYDLSGALYDLFLDADKQYSCAYFKTPQDTLEQAQAQKKAHIAAKLRLEPDMHVLDIGCGWGGMALTLAQDHAVRVTGVTLSEEQHRVATARAAEAGLSDRVRFHLRDYRLVEERFDRIVSVGMFEHVGVPHYAEYFAKVNDLLTDDGVALIHTIGRACAPGATSPWLTKYIFPGGYVPALSEVMQALEKQQLWYTDIEVWRLHYAETLRRWHDRFMARRDEAVALYDERFARMWRYYLVICEQGFRHDWQCVFQIQLAKTRDVVPLSRDYLYAGDAPVPAAQRAAE